MPRIRAGDAALSRARRRLLHQGLAMYGPTARSRPIAAYDLRGHVLQRHLGLLSRTLRRQFGRRLRWYRPLTRTPARWRSQRQSRTLLSHRARELSLQEPRPLEHQCPQQGVPPGSKTTTTRANTALGMKPIDRFGLDLRRIRFLPQHHHTLSNNDPAAERLRSTPTRVARARAVANVASWCARCSLRHDTRKPAASQPATRIAPLPSRKSVRSR
jgi:hypothetical protein